MEMRVNNDLIRKLRLSNSWSQEELAEQAGLSMRTVQRIESEGIASIQSRKAIARALNVSVSQLSIETDEGLTQSDKELRSYRFVARSAPIYYLLNAIRLFLVGFSWLGLWSIPIAVPFTLLSGVYMWEQGLMPFSPLMSAGIWIFNAIVLIPFFFLFRWAHRVSLRIEVVLEPSLLAESNPPS